MRVDVEISGIEDIQRLERDWSARTLNKTMATALTRTAVIARETLRSEAVRTLDRPTAYTLRGIRMLRPDGSPGVATADNLSIDVRIDDKQTKQGYGTPGVQYLWWQINGGANRQLKRFERALQASGHMPQGWYAMPGAGARIDAHGNISPGQIVQILSQLRSGTEKGSRRHLARGDDRKAQNSRRKAYGRAGGQYIAVTKRTKGLAPGIYLVAGQDLGARKGYRSQGYVKPVLIFVRSVAYARRYDYLGVGQSVAMRELSGQIERAMDDTRVRLASAPKVGG